MVYPEGFHYVNLSEKDIPFLVEEQFLKGRPVTKLLAPEKEEGAQELREPTTKEVRVVLEKLRQDRSAKYRRIYRGRWICRSRKSA